ncbi:MAG: hypothetical protein ACI8QI_000623 [Limisphaerales bacterium]|jgi:hypothetical protein
MFVFVPPLRGFGLAKRLFFNREWTRSDANETEHSFSLREKVAAGRMRVKPLNGLPTKPCPTTA